MRIPFAVLLPADAEVVELFHALESAAREVHVAHFRLLALACEAQHLRLFRVERDTPVASPEVEFDESRLKIQVACSAEIDRNQCDVVCKHDCERFATDSS